MLTFRRLAATALISFSFIHDLKSFTAKAAETPVEEKNLLNRSNFLDFDRCISPFLPSIVEPQRITHFIPKITPKLPSATAYHFILISLFYHLLVVYS